VKVNPENGATDKFHPDLAEENFKLLPAEFYDIALPFSIETDKKPVKFVPCGICRRAMMVTTFYVPAWANSGCRGCKGADAGGGMASVQVPQAGRTDPEKAVNLVDCLLNEEFAEASCPKCGDPMELKSVHHNPNYGPRVLIGYDKKNGDPIYDMLTGEVVMHQCNHCRTTISFSTTAQMIYRRQNEPKSTAGSRPVTEWTLGPREELDVEAAA
jgi:hypothetical protein